jgi:hypothetical protein
MCHRVSVGLLLLSLFWIDAADAQRAPRGATSWLLSVSESQVTADINRIPLRVVLEELARQVPLRFSLSEESREHPVTAHFPALPLEEALARLLTGLTYALVISVPAPPATASAETKQVVELLVSQLIQGQGKMRRWTRQLSGPPPCSTRIGRCAWKLYSVGPSKARPPPYIP